MDRTAQTPGREAPRRVAVLTLVVWPAPFPLGVADSEAGLALCKAADDLIVVRLADGQILWREPTDARPLLVGRGLAVALSADKVLAFSLEDEDRGALRWHASLPASPADADAAWVDGDIGVHWQIREHYRGGAYPGPRATTETRSGQCGIDPKSGTPHVLAHWPERVGSSQSEPSDDPSVLAACVLGRVRYRAALRSDELRLSASHASDNTIIWDQPLCAVTPRPAPRLRP